MFSTKKAQLGLLQRQLTLRTWLALAMIIVSMPVSARAWAASTERVLYAFQGGTDASVPNAGSLVSDKGGSLYGATEFGGASGYGTVFKLSPTQHGGWTETVLYSFLGGSDGNAPVGGVIFDAAGNLYGTTEFGGTYGNGTVYRLTRAKGGSWKETLLHSFRGGTDGRYPLSSLVFDQSGKLFGTTLEGGSTQRMDAGTVFELDRSTHGWTERVIYNFQGGDDGFNPAYGSLIFDGMGNLYGNADGGANGAGVVFELIHTQSGWKHTVLHVLSPREGSLLRGSPIFDAAGDLIDTAVDGGPNSCNCGTVFKLHHTGNGWRLKVLYAFRGGFDGNAPFPGLVFDRRGNLYGTTYSGGTNKNGCFNACGTVYRLSPKSGGQWTEDILYRFGITGGQTGYNPLAGLVVNGAGHLFGTTTKGGGIKCHFLGCGVVYEIAP